MSLHGPLRDLSLVSSFVLLAETPLQRGHTARRFKAALEVLWRKLGHISLFEAVATMQALVVHYSPAKSEYENAITVATVAGRKIGQLRACYIMHLCATLGPQLALFRPKGSALQYIVKK